MWCVCIYISLSEPEMASKFKMAHVEMTLAMIKPDAEKVRDEILDRNLNTHYVCVASCHVYARVRLSCCANKLL